MLEGLEMLKTQARLMALGYVPQVLETLGKLALEGSVEAARTLLEAAGVLGPALAEGSGAGEAEELRDFDL